jgi:hypothetical protein
MTKPDSNSPDPGQNQDDAVWLDLVARLEGDTADPRAAAAESGPGTPTEGTQTQGPEAEGPQTEGAAGKGGGETEAASAPGASARRPGFRDFDPLGLSHPAPTELSAAERQAAAAPRAGRQEEDVNGPRDYDGDDDEDAFVPEEPPSLANTDPLTMLAWIGAVGGPVALLLAAMFWRSAPLLAILGIVAAFVASVVYLIMKLPQEKDEHDDGARI